MNTKIQGLPGSTVRTTGPTAAAPKAAGTSKDAAAGAVGDSVRLSGEAVDLAALTKQLGGGPGFDSAKVASIRSAIDSGAYRINAQEIAQRLLNMERELGN